MLFLATRWLLKQLHDEKKTRRFVAQGQWTNFQGGFKSPYIQFRDGLDTVIKEKDTIITISTSIVISK